LAICSCQNNDNASNSDDMLIEVYLCFFYKYSMPSALRFVCDDLFTLEDVSVMANILLSASCSFIIGIWHVKFVGYIDRRYDGQGCATGSITHNIRKLV